jgi:hypothetical protein
MRGLALIGLVAVLAAGASAGGARTPTLADAALRTQHVASARYVIDVRIVRRGTPISLHIHGQAGPHTISVALRQGAMRLPDGSTVPGPRGAALIDGPFLYERAPAGIALYGKISWLRLRLADLPRASDELRAVHSMTPRPLLDVLVAARVAPRTFHGTIPYDDPAVRGIGKLMGGLEFRNLRISAEVGGDGLVHRMVITGRTADAGTTLSLRAHFFAFGEPVHVTPPAAGTFLDEHANLTA